MAHVAYETHAQASRRRLTKISSPLTWTSKASNGRGGGPEIFRPSRLYLPLWQAHQTSRRSSRYCTVQERCVHVADMARYSPLAMRISRPGRLPKRKIFPLFGFRSPTRPATTASLPRSEV